MAPVQTSIDAVPLTVRLVECEGFYTAHVEVGYPGDTYELVGESQNNAASAFADGMGLAYYMLRQQQGEGVAA